MDLWRRLSKELGRREVRSGPTLKKSASHPNKSGDPALRNRCLVPSHLSFSANI
jgi:hypothetical protein